MHSDVQNLPENLTVPRTDPVYNCHAYLTKVPIGAIKPFIEAFTKPGDIVADFFAGSGMTGLAAVKAGRQAALSDISVLGRHIALGYLTRVTDDALRKSAEEIMERARAKLGDLYTTTRGQDGQAVEMVRYVWSFTYVCPQCDQKLTFFDHVSPTGAPPTACPQCASAFSKRTWRRAEDLPVQVVVRGVTGTLTEQPIAAIDLERIATAAADKRLKEIPSLQIDETREMFSRSGLGKVGLTNTKDFFSDRNAIALYELWDAICGVADAQVRQKLRFCFTAILARASRRYQWSAKRPLNAQNQTYYIAPVYYEWNVFELFGRKVEASVRAAAELFPQDESKMVEPHATYTIASAAKLLHLSDASVDYVFTDPPFGSNIFYSDMSLFHEAWLGTSTDPADEAVVHTTGKRKVGAAERYEELLRAAFAEGFRVLKPGGHMSVVFGNSSGTVWGLVQRALRDSGFDPAPVHVSVLDKGQRSVKGLSSGSESVVTVDLVLTVRKPLATEKCKEVSLAKHVDAAALIVEAIQMFGSEDARNPSHVYARILRQAIKRHLPLDELHLGDVLVALRQAGYSIDPKTGMLAHVKLAA
jgi:16S rRNA G966 N2-methylase RsmD